MAGLPPLSAVPAAVPPLSRCCRSALLPAPPGVLLTVVVLVPRPATSDGELRELTGRIRRVGRSRVEQVLVLRDGHLPDVDPAATVTLVDGDWVGHDHALRLLTRDERRGVRSAGGLLSVDASHRADLAAAVDEAGTAAPDVVAGALARAGVAVISPVPAALVSTVPPNDAARAAAVDACTSVDEEDVRLRSAVKAEDGVFTTLAISPWSRYLARWFAQRQLTPDAVTWLALLVTLASAASFGTGSRIWLVLGAVLLELSFALDCVDGQLARYAVSYSERGAWLDAALDRLKEFLVYAGLAYGAARQGTPVWLLATLAIALQTARHTADFGFHLSASHSSASDSSTSDTSDAGPTDEVFTGRLASRRAVSLRRILALPIGERWLVIAVLAALTNAQVVFVALLLLGLLATGWTVGGRLLRSRHRASADEAGSTEVSLRLQTMSDPGPFRLPLPHGASLVRWWWLLPAALRLLEYAVIGLLGALLAHAADGHGGLTHAPAAAFTLVLVLAQRHYDVVYRLMAHPPLPVRPPLLWTLGVAGRLVLVWLAALAGWLGVGVLVALAAWVAGCVLLGASDRFRETAPRRGRSRTPSTAATVQDQRQDQ